MARARPYVLLSTFFLHFLQLKSVSQSVTNTVTSRLVFQYIEISEHILKNKLTTAITNKLTSRPKQVQTTA